MLHSTFSYFHGSKYFPNHKLPENLIATTDAKSALQGADFCLHAVPVQVSNLLTISLSTHDLFFSVNYCAVCICLIEERAHLVLFLLCEICCTHVVYCSLCFCILQFTASFLESIVDYVDPGLPFISLSKGLELNTLRMMSQIIPQALKNPRQPFLALSGPSFASELMNKLPTGPLCCWLKVLALSCFSCVMFSPILVHLCLTLIFTAMVVASRDKKLVNQVQQLLASERLRINTSR